MKIKILCEVGIHSGKATKFISNIKHTTKTQFEYIQDAVLVVESMQERSMCKASKRLAKTLDL